MTFGHALVALNLVAAFNGVALGVILILQDLAQPTRARLSLAAFLILISSLLAWFVVLDLGLFVYSAPIGGVMDVAAILASAFFFDYVRTSVSARPAALWPFAPAALYLIGAIFSGGRIGAEEDMRLVIAVQIAFTAGAVLIYLRARSSLPPGWAKRRENRFLPLLLGGVCLLHAAQLLRLAAPQSNLTFDLVPLVGALGLLAFAAYALAGSQTLRALPAPRRAVAPDDDIGARLDAAMAEARAFLDPDLSLQKAAALIGVAPRRLSEHLNGARGQSFRAYVNALRIGEAKLLLVDPTEAQTSIEAIAMMSGFRARSSFYEAFRAHEGQSPQEFRANAAKPASG